MTRNAMTTDKILTERSGPVTTIVINRPKSKNALDNEAAHGLAAALKAFEADVDARVGVLTGAGGAFCAGADLKELGGGTDYFPWAGSTEGPLRAPLSKPVIAAVEGHACAGGLGVALFCDIRIVDETAVFGVFSRRWGVPMSDGTTVRLPRIIGQGRALDMLLTARDDDRGLSADRHDVGPAVGLRELRPRPGCRDPARGGAVTRGAAQGVADRRCALRIGRRTARQIPEVVARQPRVRPIHS
jgi:1,4-dihydroxy-2-naphthoyl-CoA synthase